MQCISAHNLRAINSFRRKSKLTFIWQQSDIGAERRISPQTLRLQPIENTKKLDKTEFFRWADRVIVKLRRCEFVSNLLYTCLQCCQVDGGGVRTPWRCTSKCFSLLMRAATRNHLMRADGTTLFSLPASASASLTARSSREGAAAEKNDVRGHFCLLVRVCWFLP